MKEQFENLWYRLEVEGDSDFEFQFLYDSYSQPYRYYHNLNHIQTCLQDFRQVSALAVNPELVELAIWYHDIIYDVTRFDNERKSADFAFGVCRKIGLSEEAAQEVYNLILYTYHVKYPETNDQKIIVDVDLAILGKPSAEYDAYEKAIRKEYAHVPTEEFRKARKTILLAFLEKLSIYSLDYFRIRYQRQAVENIQHAIKDLP